VPTPHTADLHAQGRAAQLEGRPDDAIAAFQQALADDPSFAAAAADLGAALLQAGQAADAEPVLRLACELAPREATARCNLGSALQQLGRDDEAVAALRQAIALAPGLVVAHFNLGNAHAARADWGAAVDAFRRVVALDPRHGPGWFNLGHALHQLDQLDEAADAYWRASQAQPLDPRPLTLLGTVLKDQNRVADAADCFRRALALRPGDALLQHNLRSALARQIQPWHLPMLADDGRNDAYRRAIERAVTARSRVLDIGTGSGLLAMMAARAGAASVTACEMSPVVADAARDVVAANGFADTVTVHAMKSTALQLGRDLPERADLLVSEIVDVGLLGEGVLPAVRHARAHLLTPDATIVPSAARVFAMLVEVPRLRRVHPVRTVCGFDLSAFDRFRAPGEYVDLRLDLEPHRCLSAPVPVAAFDFHDPPPYRSDAAPATHRVAVDVSADGFAHAVAFWFELQLDDATTLSTAPGAGSTAWGQALQFLEDDRPLRAGQSLALCVRQSDTSIAFELDGAGREAVGYAQAVAAGEPAEG
jgi:tetratricopeptide (TPR) repeat protein